MDKNKHAVADGNGVFACGACGMRYRGDAASPHAGKEWAEKCEAWCRAHQSCNLDIVKHAVPEPLQEPSGMSAME